MNEKILPNNAIDNVSTKRKLFGILYYIIKISLKIIKHKNANIKNVKKTHSSNSA